MGKNAYPANFYTKGTVASKISIFHQPGLPTPPPEIRRHLKSLTMAELQRAKEFHKAMENYETALKYIERQMAISTDPREIKGLKLELADAHFQNGNMEKATKAYTIYLAAYPGSTEAPYALYKGLLALFYTTLTPDRDPSRTKMVLNLTRTYLQRSTDGAQGYEAYENEVKKIEQECAQKIVDHHQGIFDFYYNQGQYDAATTRLVAMKKELIPLTEQIGTSIEPQLLWLEAKVYASLGKKELATAKKEEVALRFPVYHAQQLAQATFIPRRKNFSGHHKKQA